MATRRLLRDADWLLLGAALVVSALGLVAIAAASGHSLHDPAVRYILKRQVLWAAAGLVVLAVLALTDYHFWLRWWRVFYAGALLLLMVVLVLGRHQLGAQRWIAVGPLDLQPSELSKLAVILALGATLSVHRGQMRRWRDALVPAACVLLPAGLVLLQPDLGTSLVFVAIFVGMLYAAGFPGPRLVLGGLACALLGASLIVAHFRWPHLVPLPLHTYQVNRLLAFINPQADPLGNGYHVLQSEMAIGSGRLFGNGVFSGGAGGQLAYLPEANTDFVFASVGDVLGFVGAATLVAGLALVVWRALACAAAARDVPGALLAAGVGCMLGFQTVLNIGVTLGVMPVTGVPLPFTSYGGSATLVNFAALGLVESVYLRRRRLRL